MLFHITAQHDHTTCGRVQNGKAVKFTLRLRMTYEGLTEAVIKRPYVKGRRYSLRTKTNR